MNTPRPIVAALSSSIVWMVGLFWLVSVIGVMVWITVHSNFPNTAGRPPVLWPEQSQISHVEGRPTLMMFVHPHCPCSRASVGELARLLVQDRGLGRVHVLFVNPPGMSPDWAKTALWEQASIIPGVTVHLDQGGVEAKRLGVETSGQTLLYDASGHLSFAGGITVSRGHAGDSLGRSSLMALFAHESSDLSQTPVFGCSLFDVGCEQGEAICKP